jgi:hypothetical protein
MSFIVGFMDQYNRIQDKKEKRELLAQELRAKRENELIGLIGKRQKRTKASANESSALNALSVRIGDAEGKDDYLRAVAKAGVAGQIMGGINELELDDPNRELRLEGRNIMDNFSVFYEEGSPSVKTPTLQDIEGASYEELRQMKVDLLSATEAPSSSYVDVNTQGVFAGSNRLRSEAQSQYDNLLVETFSGSVTDSTEPENVAMVQAINDLQSDSPVARTRARNKLMRTPEGVAIYGQMMEMSANIPSFGVLKDIPGTFNELDRAYYVVSNWDRLNDENRSRALQAFPYIQSLVRN